MNCDSTETSGHEDRWLLKDSSTAWANCGPRNQSLKESQNGFRSGGKRLDQPLTSRSETILGFLQRLVPRSAVCPRRARILQQPTIFVARSLRRVAVHSSSARLLPWPTLRSLHEAGRAPDLSRARRQCRTSRHFALSSEGSVVHLS